MLGALAGATIRDPGALVGIGGNGIIEGARLAVGGSDGDLALLGNTGLDGACGGLGEEGDTERGLLANRSALGMIIALLNITHRERMLYSLGASRRRRFFGQATLMQACKVHSRDCLDPKLPA